MEEYHEAAEQSMGAICLSMVLSVLLVGWVLAIEAARWVRGRLDRRGWWER